MKGYLCYSVVHFHFKSRKRQYVMRDNHLPHLDSMDDWWDYWFTTGNIPTKSVGIMRTGNVCSEISRFTSILPILHSMTASV